MITLPADLATFMQGQDLKGLKPYAVLFRNKWVPEESESGESGESGGYFALDTNNPIDITALITKPNTLSMTLDVNEVAQYNANNVTLTLEDTKNYFVEGTPNSYFPAGYQIYGSRVVLYYGIDDTNRTPLFTGVIKELPSHKPDKYQVDLKLVSPLEMLKDIEAKDFSDKVTGETLTYKSTDSDGHRIYWTTGTGVGGFDAVYADGTKLFEGVDYETAKLNALGLPAIVTIINSDYYSSTITADYYTWKTGLSVEQIIAGLVGLAGYNSGTEDIRNVVWNTDIRTAISPNFLFSQGYSHQGVSFNYSGAGNYSYGDTLPPMGIGPIMDWDNNSVIKSTTVFPTNFTYEIQIAATPQLAIGIDGQTTLRIGDTNKFFLFSSSRAGRVRVVYQDGDISSWVYWYIYTTNDNKIRIEKNGTTFSFYGYEELMPEAQKTIVSDMNLNVDNNIRMMNSNAQNRYRLLLSQKLTDLQSGISLEKYGIAFELNRAEATKWANIYADKSNADAPVSVIYRTSNDWSIYSNWNTIDLGTNIGETSNIIQFTIVLNNNSNTTNFTNVGLFYLGSTLTLQLVNLTGKTVLEALQDFALISGYEFGVDRQGVFFFRPRVASTTPTYTLDGNEVVQIDTVKKSLNDFFTKLTLTFAEVPLEFYANTGTRPTPIDKYGVLNKDIDKPEIVNYDNPELAQAIGPQLLEVYSALPNIIQAVGKLNLALELGDIVILKRNLNLIADPEWSDFSKYIRQQTYYRACKITGMNYNFAKRQITYTLRDVSNVNNMPPINAYGFVYERNKSVNN